MLSYNRFTTLVTMVTAWMAGVGAVDTPANTTCYCLTEELHSLRNPVHMEATTLDGRSVFLIAEQLGIIRVYNPSDPNNKLTTYMDLTDRIFSTPVFFEERGLLGFALHPQFITNKILFLYSIRKVNGTDYVVISKIEDKKLDEEKTLMWIEEPGKRNNGGQLLFGEDGYLYVFIGDGQPASDQRNDAQNVDNFLGKVLRLDVDNEGVYDYRWRYYDIPADNPKTSGWREEIYALGIRNMWRCSVDKGDKQGADKGRIFCGDLGDNKADEINLIHNGSNYGWHYREGFNCTNISKCKSLENERLPIYAFNRSGPLGITALVGGPIYRGSMFPGVYGQLIFGDFSTGHTHSLKETKSNTDGKGSWSPDGFTQCNKQRCGCSARANSRTHLLTFGTSLDDELFLLMTDDPNPSSPKGALLKLVQPQSSESVTCGTSKPYLSFWNLIGLLLIYEFVVCRA